MIVFSILFVLQDNVFLKNFLIVMISLLAVHLVFGFYFMANPSALISFGKKYFSLDVVFYNKFLSFVNAGAFMGITPHYSTSGMYMAVAVVLITAFVFAYRSKYKKWNVPAIILFVLFFVALALTQKRGQLLFSSVAIVLIYLIGYVNGNLNRRILQVLGGVLLLIVAFFVFLNIPAFQATILRYFSGGDLDEVSSGRVSQLWVPAIQEFLEHPLFGIGWRQFKYAHPMNNGVNNDAHNIYLQLLAENGIFAGLYIVVLMIYTYVSTWKMLRICKNEDNFDDYLFLLFSFGYQTFFLLYGLTGNPLYEMSCLFPYFLSCCICYMYSAEHGYDRVIVKMTAVFRRV